jgi:hypothetical protein
LPMGSPSREALPPWARSSSKNPPSVLAAHEDVVALIPKDPDRSLMSMSRRVLSNIVHRSRSQRAVKAIDAVSEGNSSVSLYGAASSATLNQNEHEATQVLFEEEAQLAFEQELLAQQIQTELPANDDQNQANIEMLSQTRIIPHRGESAMEHLLELRTAVNGLTVLGRPEGAARLLEEHVAADPGTCAWAYLEYMHLCEQLELRDDFESMRKKYRQQFNRMAPYWYEPNANVLGLDGYSRAANELCAAWQQGQQQAQQTLSTWLAGPLLARKLVQLPAYHDLFDLYEILEFIQIDQEASAALASDTRAQNASAQNLMSEKLGEAVSSPSDIEQDFVPTVSLLDLDYEFSSDVTLEEHEVQESEKAVTIVKTGNFSVDFNVAGTQFGGLPASQSVFDKK